MSAAAATERDSRRALALATTAYVLGWTAHTTFIFYLAPIALRLGDAAGRDAWIFSGTAVASIVASLPVGRLADRVPRRRVMRAGLALLGLAYVPLVLLPPSFGATLAATLITGTGLSALFVAFNSYVPDLLAAGRGMGTAYGRASALSVLASALGPLVAAGVFGLVGAEAPALRANALLFALAAGAGALLTLTLPSVAHRRPRGPERAGALGVWRTERGAVLLTTLLYLTLGVGFGATTPYFAVYFLDEVHMAEETWGLVLAAATVASALGAVAVGRLASVVAPRALLVAPQVAHLAAAVPFLLPLAPITLGAAFVLRHAFSATTAPVLNALLMPQVDANARGRVQSWGSLAWNVGWATGAAAGGPLLARLHGGLFPTGALLCLLGATVALLIARPGAGRQP